MRKEDFIADAAKLLAVAFVQRGGTMTHDSNKLAVLAARQLAEEVRSQGVQDWEPDPKVESAYEKTLKGTPR